MTSSVHDSNGAEEPQKQSEAQTQHQSSTNGIFQPGAPPSSEHMMPPHFEVGHAMSQAVYPYQDPYYRSIFAPYCPQPQPMIHTHVMGIQPAVVPLPSDTVEEPVYVNAKQYHGIMRRRQSRAKAESENKLIKSRKPYLHESRHLHAVRRARALSGRFLNSKTDEQQQNDGTSCDNAHPSENCKSDDTQDTCSDRAS